MHRTERAEREPLEAGIARLRDVIAHLQQMPGGYFGRCRLDVFITRDSVTHTVIKPRAEQRVEV